MGTAHRPTNKDIVHLLRSVATAYQLSGAIHFKVVAYQRAADTIEHLTQEIYDIWQNNQLSTIDGVGPSIRQHLDEYFKKPHGSHIEKQIAKIPAPVYELMRAPGIGPKKAFAIVSALHFEKSKDIFADVKKAAKDGRIAELPGFGKKSEEDIMSAIGVHKERGEKEDRMKLPVAMTIAENVSKYISEHQHVDNVKPMGSLRRKVPTIGDVDLLVVCDKKYAKDVVSHFVKFPHKISVEGEGESKGAIMVSGGRRVDLRVVSKEQYGSMIQYFTGNKSHNIKLRERALKKHLSLSEFGIKNTKTGTVKTFSSEKDFYAFLGLDWIPPEIREGHDEITHAAHHTLPTLVKEEDIKGDFHVHSDFDVTTSHDTGQNSIKEMAKKAEQRGYSHLALSEHNPAISKLSPDKITDIIKRKKEAIGKVKTPVHIFNSLEIDIQPDGSLALPDEAFKHLDMAVVSIHSSFGMSRSDMTKRILKALFYPKVKVLGHPTGRLLGKREEIDADWTAIFKKAKENNIALEINSYPDRLDLPDGLVKQAVDNGNKLVINTDAHSAKDMDFISYGVFVARRGWAQKGDIMNAQSLKTVTSWIKK